MGKQIVFWAGIAVVISSLVLSCSDDSVSSGTTTGGDNNCTAPSAPSAVLTSALSPSSIRITWALVDNATFYNVYRSGTPSGTYRLLESLLGTTYDDTELTPGTTYYYKIAAENDCGEGAMSSFKSETTDDCQRPGTPANVNAASLSPVSIRVSWDSIPNAASYTVYRKSSADGEFTDSIASTTGRTFTHAGLSPSTTHYYRIVAVNNCGKGEMSTYASATTESCPAPAAPANVSAQTRSSTSLEISWGEVNTAVSYKIYRSATTTGTYQHIATVHGKDNTSYTDENLTTATTYYYKVSAESNCAESPQSNYGFASTTCDLIPPAPGSVTATALSSTEISVSWSAVSGARTYSLYVATSPDGDYRRRMWNISNTSVPMSDLMPGTTYYFKVASANNCSEDSELSADFASATTINCDLPVPPEPSGLTARPLSSKSVELAWDGVTGADHYTIYRATERDGRYSYVERTDNTFFTDTTASASTQYFYGVISVNACGGYLNSISDVVSATTICETAVPTNVAATARSSSSIEIAWDAVSGAVSYGIYRASISTGTYELLGRTSNNSYTDSGLSNLTTYFYKITAKTDICDESRQSEPTHTTTQ